MSHSPGSQADRRRASMLRFLAPALGLALVASLSAGCDFFSPQPVPTGSGTHPTPSPSPTVKPTPTPLPNPVASIVLVGAVGETEPGSRSVLAWQGVEAAAKRLGSLTAQVVPAGSAQLYAAVAKAAAGEPVAGVGASPSAAPGAGTPTPRPQGAIVVVTAGPAGAAAALAAAASHPQTQFFVLDQAIADDAPANVHGLVFDEAEAGYLAGVVAAGAIAAAPSPQTPPIVGFVAAAAGDRAATGYLAGLQNGVRQVDAAAAVRTSYAGSAVDPARGRASASALAKAGAGALVALPDLTGYGAMRQACAQKLPVVALATDAAQLLPDVKSCLVASILKRYDRAVAVAVVGYAEGRPVPRVATGNVASDCLDVTALSENAPAGLAERLAEVLSAMHKEPPRPSPTPLPTETGAAPS